jgi:AcrR family transcriptional regulator
MFVKRVACPTGTGSLVEMYERAKTEMAPMAAVARRSQETRRREMRQKLLQATIDVLLESGYAGLTTAQVDAKAGVSSGARAHHFPTKADLVIAAAEHIYERAGELGRQRAVSAVTAPDPLRAFVDDCLSIYFDWPFLSSVEIVIAARTDEALMARIHPVLDAFHGKMRGAWHEALLGAGYAPDKAETALRLTLNLIRGMAVNRIWENDEREYKKLLDLWCERLAPHAREKADTGAARPAPKKV